MRSYIRLSDYKILFGPTSPLIAFVLPWVVVLIGQQLALCEIILPIYSSFYLVIFGNIFTSFFIAFMIQSFFPQRLSNGQADLKKLSISERLKKITFGLIYFYLGFQVFQVIYFQGFPLLWLLKGNQTLSYATYGLNSLNGLLNAIYLLSTTIFYLIYLKEKKRSQFYFLLFLLSIPILLICRQLIFSVFLQIACCMLLYRPKVIKKIAVFFVSILLMFAVMGNMRTGLGNLIKILQPKEYIPESLYSLLWIYAYVVTPFNNMNAAVDEITPLGVPYYEVSSLLPSVFRLPFLIGEGGDTGFKLVHDSLNASSFYQPLVLDFGQVYAFFFMAFFQVILFLSYRLALRAKTWTDVIEYSALYMVMVLSIFFNLLLFLPVIAQLVILRVARLKLFYRKDVLAIGSSQF